MPRTFANLASSRVQMFNNFLQFPAKLLPRNKVESRKHVGVEMANKLLVPNGTNTLGCLRRDSSITSVTSIRFVNYISQL